MPNIGETTVLIVEDETLIAFDLSDTLEAAGYRVLGPAASSAEALAMLGDSRPDLAVIDLILKDGACHELLRRLQQQGVPVVIHSGDRLGHHDAIEFREFPWISKPASPRDLLSWLERPEHAKPLRLPPWPRCEVPSSRGRDTLAF